MKFVIRKSNRFCVQFYPISISIVHFIQLIITFFTDL